MMNLYLVVGVQCCFINLRWSWEYPDVISGLRPLQDPTKKGEEVPSGDGDNTSTRPSFFVPSATFPGRQKAPELPAGVGGPPFGTGSTRICTGSKRVACFLGNVHISQSCFWLKITMICDFNPHISTNIPRCSAFLSLGRCHKLLGDPASRRALACPNGCGPLGPWVAGTWPCPTLRLSGGQGNFGFGPNASLLGSRATLASWGIINNWLVVWNIFIFPYIGNNHPNWLILFRGVETTIQTM